MQATGRVGLGFGIKRAALLGAALWMVAGCASQPADDPEIQDVVTIDYICEDGTRLGVWFEPDSAIITENGGETLNLKQQRAGSGFWYALDQAEFRGKGDSATWTSGQRPATTCQAAGSAPAAG